MLAAGRRSPRCRSRSWACSFWARSTRRGSWTVRSSAASTPRSEPTRQASRWTTSLLRYVRGTRPPLGWLSPWNGSRMSFGTSFANGWVLMTSDPQHDPERAAREAERVEHVDEALREAAAVQQKATKVVDRLERLRDSYRQATSALKGDRKRGP